jgi:hypothetical protein
MTKKITYDEVMAMMAENSAQLAKTDVQMAENAVRFEETRKLIAANAAEAKARSALIDAQIAETEKTVKSISEQLGNIGHNNGEFAEEYFANDLEDKKTFAGMLFDEVGRNIKGIHGKLKDEFDIVMYNSVAVVIMEIKYKVHVNYLEEMVEKKVKNFRELFPYYKDYKIYLGIGSMSFYDDVVTKAKELGIAILRQKGETIEVDTETIKAY